MIRIRNLGKSIDNKEILKSLNVDINAGDFVSVVGPSGSGKTTLLNIILSISAKSSGSYKFNDENIEDIFDSVDKIRNFRNSIGVMSTYSHLIPSLNIKDNILLPTIISDLNLNDDYYYELIEKLKIEKIIQNDIDSLSSGEKQRVLLARALMPEPEILFLDEPTSGLDLRGREELLIALSNLVNEEKSPPMILVTHHLEEIPVGFGHLLLLKNGKTVASGKMQEVMTSENISECFSLNASVNNNAGRWSINILKSEHE